MQALGGIQQLRGQNFAIFWHPPLCGQFLYPERRQKDNFFDPLSPSSGPRSYWMAPYKKERFYMLTYVSSCWPTIKRYVQLLQGRP